MGIAKQNNDRIKIVGRPARDLNTAPREKSLKKLDRDARAYIDIPSIYRT
jgi:hypothetical protein